VKEKFHVVRQPPRTLQKKVKIFLVLAFPFEEVSLDLVYDFSFN
jgi:hypothetical protein